MLLRISIFLFCSLWFFTSQAQLNPYKYIVVPTHFEDFRKVNQHQTSTIIKYYLTENGFPAVYDTQQPTEVKINPCQAAYVKLKDDSGMFLTRVVVRFVDCEGNVLLETQEGTSKEKDFGKSYKEALGNAFESMAGMGYSYMPQKDGQVSEETLPAVPEGPARQAVGRSSVASDAQSADNSQIEMAGALEAAREAVPEGRESPVSAGTITSADTRQGDPASAVQDESLQPGVSSRELLYAQEIDNGYQLVDSSPKIRMKLIRTSREDRFIVLVDGQANGIVFLDGNNWVHEYFRNGEVRTEVLRIRF